jgi:short subunit dehydrogenase-like uncharacterized protein
MTDSLADPHDLDLVLFGASGFVGRLVAGYLAEHAPSGARIGLAGRSATAVEQVRAGLGDAAASWPVLTADAADAADAAALARLAGATRVVVSTVGPYQRYGLGLVQACAEAGTHYADLTGELLFVRETIDRFHALAQASGARIVHSCGFDSVPSDLGVLLLHEAVTADDAGELEDVTLSVVSMRGGISGGTIDSARVQAESIAADRTLRRVIADPYALSPDRDAEPSLGDERDRTWIGRDSETGRWIGPFVMAGYNTRVVRRSNALLDRAYGHRLRYREVISYGRSRVAPALAALATTGLGAFGAGMSFGPTRAVLDRLLPAPGQGPNEQARRRGRFALELRGHTSTGARYLARVEAEGDPGYQATSVMLGESGLCLALDGDRLPARAGVLTPATALGMPLVERLRSAGFRLDVERLAV